MRLFGFRIRKLYVIAFITGVLFTPVATQLYHWGKDRGPATVVYWRDILTPRVAPGQEYVHVNDFMRLKFCSTRVYRWLIDKNGKRHDLETLTSALPTTGLNVRQQTEARILIPANMPEGPASLWFRVRWRCNPLHQVWPIWGPLESILFRIDKTAPPAPAPIKRQPKQVQDVPSPSPSPEFSDLASTTAYAPSALALVEGGEEGDGDGYGPDVGR